MAAAVKTWSDPDSPRRVWVAELPDFGVVGIGELKRTSPSCREIAYAVHMMLRPGNAGSNTAVDHIVVLTEALTSVPARYRPTPAGLDHPDVFEQTNTPTVLVRSDSAGATHTFAKACRDMGVGFSFGFAVRPQ